MEEDNRKARRKRRREEEQALRDDRALEADRRREEDADAVFVDLMFGAIGLSVEERLRRLNDRLAELDELTRNALIAAERRAEEARERLEDIQRRASVTADGRRIYRTADGTRAFYEDGKEATAAEMVDVDWRPDAASWEDRQDGARMLEEAERERDEIVRYRDEVLNPARERARAGGLSADELDSLEAELENLPPSLRGSLERPDAVRSSAARREMPDGSFSNAPDAGAEFARANAAPVAEDRPAWRPAPGAAPDTSPA